MKEKLNVALINILRGRSNEVSWHLGSGPLFNILQRFSYDFELLRFNDAAES
jgi:hypothetical protein